MDDYFIYSQLRHIRVNQMVIMRMLSRALNQEANIMADVQDILDKQAASLKKATDALTLDAAIKAVLDGNTVTMQDLQTKLDAAIAAGDPAKIQAISDNMDAIIAAQDTDAAAKAILAGTPPGTGNL